MNEKLVRAGLATVSTAGFLLLGSCSSQPPRDDIFNNRGGYMPPPTRSTGGGVPAAPSGVSTPIQGTGLILNDAPGGPDGGIVIDEQPALVNNPPVQSYKAPPEVSTMSYTVKRGDSLWKVAKNHGVSVDDLARVNDISKSSGLKIGQKLSLPVGASYKPVTSKSSKKPSAKPGANYTVKRGDSLSVIAWRYKTSVSAIKSENGLKSNNIRIGQKLIIPGGNSPRPYKGGGSSSSLPNVSGNVYTIKKGDSLSVIAQKYGTSVKSLKAANGLKGNNIIVGKKLVIPADAKNKVGEPTQKQKDIKTKLTQKKPKKPEVEPVDTDLFEDPSVGSDPFKEEKTEEGSIAESVISENELDTSANPLANMKLMDVLVVESDTLESLSSDFNTTQELILKANENIKGNEDLKPGMVIKVPKAQ